PEVREQGHYFLAITVPFLAWHSSSVTSTKPFWPQPLWPAHAFASVLHAPLPLHSLMPMQWTLAVFSSGLAMSPAGLAMSPAGLAMSPAGLAMSPAGAGCCSSFLHAAAKRLPAAIAI